MIQSSLFNYYFMILFVYHYARKIYFYGSVPIYPIVVLLLVPPPPPPPPFFSFSLSFSFFASFLLLTLMLSLTPLFKVVRTIGACRFFSPATPSTNTNTQLTFRDLGTTFVTHGWHICICSRKALRFFARLLCGGIDANIYLPR